VAQAADITAFKATLVPVGADQAPMMEINRCITRQMNRTPVRLSKATLAGSTFLNSAKGAASPVLAEFLAGMDETGSVSGR
jgi:tryptophanyl-tRNA synthetase